MILHLSVVFPRQFDETLENMMFITKRKKKVKNNLYVMITRTKIYKKVRKLKIYLQILGLNLQAVGVNLYQVSLRSHHLVVNLKNI